MLDLEGIILQSYLNRIHTTVYTSNDGNYASNGGLLMGLGDRVTTDLFLPNGTWSLWNRGKAI